MLSLSSVELPVERLHEYAKDYAFLYHWLLLAATGQDPVSRIALERKFDKSDMPNIGILDRPIATGLKPPFDRSLLLVPKTAWLAMADDLRAISYLAREFNSYWQTMLQELTLLPGPTHFDVLFVGVDGSHACYHYRPKGHYAELVKAKPLPDTLRMAKLLLGNADQATLIKELPRKGKT